MSSYPFQPPFLDSSPHCHIFPWKAISADLGLNVPWFVESSPRLSWKPPRRSWKPPRCSWKPPRCSWKPPRRSWKPPRCSWKPPRRSWKPCLGTTQGQVYIMCSSQTRLLCNVFFSACRECWSVCVSFATYCSRSFLLKQHVFLSHWERCSRVIRIFNV